MVLGEGAEANTTLLLQVDDSLVSLRQLLAQHGSFFSNFLGFVVLLLLVLENAIQNCVAALLVQVDDRVGHYVFHAFGRQVVQ